MIGTIQAARPSKSGKTLSIQIDGQWYQTKLWDLQQAVGRKIAGETSESEYNGQKVRWLNSFSFADAGAPTPRINPVPNIVGPRLEAQEIDYRPLVSNLAAHLISANKSPQELREWVEACKAILEGKEPERIPGEDDFIPTDLAPPY